MAAFNCYPGKLESLEGQPEDRPMNCKRFRPVLSIAGVCGALVLAANLSFAQDGPSHEEKATLARQGYMKLVVWEAGPLFGMAKGDIAYDAAAASEHAKRLQTLSDYPAVDLFVAGSSNADLPGKTRSLPKIWEDKAGFDKAFTDFDAAVAKVASQAGGGQAELAAAVGELGKSCGGCHKPFRADK